MTTASRSVLRAQSPQASWARCSGTSAKMAAPATDGMDVETIELNELIQETRNTLLSAIPDLDIYSK